MPRKKTEAMPEEQPEQTEIEPGEGVDIHLARLESGEWFGRIGEPDDDAALVATAAWPWEALRGLAKQVKQSDGALAAYRIVGEQEMGRCEHASSDSGACVLLGCPIEEAEATAQRLLSGGSARDLAVAVSDRVEIVRLYARLEKPRLVGEEEGEELTATLKMTGEDLMEEYGYLRNEAGNQVLAIIYHALNAPPKSKPHPDQRSMEFAGDTAGPPVVDSCGELVRFIPPDRVDEISDAVCGLALQKDGQAKACIAIGDDRFVVTEITGSDPISWEAWRAFPLEVWREIPLDLDDGHESGACHTIKESKELHELRIMVPDQDGEPFVLVGPPVRILVQPQDEEPEAEEQAETGDEPIEGDAD